MKKHITETQQSAINNLLKDSIPELSSSQAEALLKKRARLAAGIRDLFMRLGASHEALLSNDKPCSKRTTSEQIEEWEALYAVLSLNLQPDKIKVPRRQSGFDRLLVMAETVTDLAYRKSAGYFADHSLFNIAKTITVHDRTSESCPYAVWVRDRQEPDEELLEHSASDCRAKGVKGITLPEHLLFGIMFHAETGRRLDVNKWTQCIGSRTTDGKIPKIRCSAEGIEIVLIHPDHACGCETTRAVVALT